MILALWSWSRCSMNKEAYYGLSRETLQTILKNISYEIYVTDANLTIMYVSGDSLRHYGLKPEDMIGHNHKEFSGTYWYPSVLLRMYEEKRRMCIQQVTATGEKIISTAVPVFDANHNVKMAVSIVQEEVGDLDMGVDLEAGSKYSVWAQRNTNKDVPVSDIITRSPVMQNLLTLSKRAADRDIPVLIEGDSGTGKGMLARYIHENSGRSKFPFLTINCAAIPENLLESELFGYAPYAFTGASSKGKAGLIEQADGGTLFLDELAELTLPLQAKLLNVVENSQYMQVGGKEIKNANVRIISATNQPLERLVRTGVFREDLFWRLNIIDLKIPPLVERREDIIPLASYYLNLYNKKYKMNKGISEEAFGVFLQYAWPGNVRQLRNIIERAFVLSADPEITARELPAILLQVGEAANVRGRGPGPGDLHAQLEDREREYIRAAWAKHGSSRKMAAALGVSQSKANRLVQKHFGSLQGKGGL